MVENYHLVKRHQGVQHLDMHCSHQSKMQFVKTDSKTDVGLWNTCCSISSVAFSFSLCSSRQNSRSRIFSPWASTWSVSTLTCTVEKKQCTFSTSHPCHMCHLKNCMWITVLDGPKIKWDHGRRRSCSRALQWTQHVAKATGEEGKLSLTLTGISAKVLVDALQFCISPSDLSRKFS